MKKGRLAVAVSRFNEEITGKLLASCLKTLQAAGVKEPEVVRVPGGFELPWTVQELALSGRYKAVIALGCILKGQTPQNEHMARSVVQHLHDISLRARVPVILGVITPDTEEQAQARTHGENDRGREAALAALDMLKVARQLKGKR